MTNVVYQLTDRISDGAAPEINNIRKYLFVGYARTLSRIAENTGILCLCGKGNIKNPSDDGAFIDDLENAILCRDLLRAMPLKILKAVILRHMNGCKSVKTRVGSGL